MKNNQFYSACGLLMLGLFFTSCSGTAPSVKAISGTYLAVSESEWSEEIDLKADGTVIVRKAEWLAGDPGSRTTHEYIGRWKLDASVVEVELLESKGGGTVTAPNIALFRFDVRLSLEELGREERLPGLSRLDRSDEGSSISSLAFWRKDALKGLQWP